jgi:arylsulfatase A-like enzyme
VSKSFPDDKINNYILLISKRIAKMNYLLFKSTSYHMKFLLRASMLLILFSCGNEKTSDAIKPNMIYILADDLGYGDLGCYGQQIIHTPRIDRMAREGIRFTNHYSGSTVCAPSRCTLMTGLNTGHARVRGNANVPLRPEDITVAELLKEAGYATALVGKWGLGEAGSTGTPNKQGFDYFYGYLNQIRAHNSYPDYLWRNDQQIPLDNEIEIIQHSYAKGVGSVAREKKTHSQDLFTSEALNFIESNQDSSFFLYLAYTIPHANNEGIPMGEIGMEVPALGMYKDKDWPEAQKAHAAMITYLDKDVGRILDKLQSLGIDERTLVIFTSDNGPHAEGGADPEFFDSNGPLKGMKRDLFEGGIRIPMIAWWPGKIDPETESDHISAFWDFLPTACEIAGVEYTGNTDGISFLPAMLGADQKTHDHLYWEFMELGGCQAVRQGNWKAVKYGMTGSIDVPMQLFDLNNDIGEDNDLANDHPEIIQEMELIIKNSRTPSGEFQFDFEKSE